MALKYQSPEQSLFLLIDIALLGPPIILNLCYLLRPIHWIWRGNWAPMTFQLNSLFFRPPLDLQWIISWRPIFFPNILPFLFLSLCLNWIIRICPFFLKLVFFPPYIWSFSFFVPSFYRFRAYFPLFHTLPPKKSASVWVHFPIIFWKCYLLVPSQSYI